MTSPCQCYPCDSEVAGVPPDMRLGDTCLLCLRRECWRCERRIDIDEEAMIIEDGRGSDGLGYIDVCDECLRPTDREYQQCPVT